jgi:hypothetical protein
MNTYTIMQELSSTTMNETTTTWQQLSLNTTHTSPHLSLLQGNGEVKDNDVLECFKQQLLLFNDGGFQLLKL